MNASEFIKQLRLLPHPEGGYYRETYRSAGTLDATGFSGPRNYCTAIYFLLEEGNFSAFHRIKSDEMWHFYAGSALEVIEINEKGEVKTTAVGNDILKGEVPQYFVTAGVWFGSRVKKGGEFSLVGCTVSPGFDFNDFEMAKRDELSQEFPKHNAIIKEMTRV